MNFAEDNDTVLREIRALNATQTSSLLVAFARTGDGSLGDAVIASSAGTPPFRFGLRSAAR